MATYGGGAVGGAGGLQLNAPLRDFLDFWSGAAVRQFDGADPISRIQARWAVPRLFLPATQIGNSAHDGTYLVSAWIGVDGVSATVGMLRVGVDCQVVVKQGQAQPAYSSWAIWEPTVAGGIQAKKWPLVPVDGGQSVFCTISCPNNDTNAKVTFGVDGGPPPITTDLQLPFALEGNSAVWIVGTERAGELWPGPYIFPRRYFPVTFTGALAGTNTWWGCLGVGRGVEIDYVPYHAGAKILSEGRIVSTDTLVCSAPERDKAPTHLVG